VDVSLSAEGTLTFGNAAVAAGVAEAPQGYAIEWARFDNATGQVTPLGSPVTVTGPRAAAPSLPGDPGAFVRVRIAATGGPRAWADPVDADFRRAGGGWTLVGLERHLAPATR
jgi:hypothetical protein